MTYQGHITNGTIVLDEPADLPEGLQVKVDVRPLEGADGEDNIPTLAERLASVIGKAKGLPADWSENHDKYLRVEHGQ